MDRDTLLSHYKKIGKIRRSNEVYKEGAFKLLYLDSELLIFERYDENNTFITIYNNGKEDITLRFTEKFSSLFSLASGKSLLLPAGTAEILQTEKRGIMVLD